MADNNIMINHMLNHIKSIKTVDMDIRLSVLMIINVVNQFRYTGGENAIHKFMEKILEEVEWCKK